MKLWMLGSGSRGNAVLVECDDTRILIDCGFGSRVEGRFIEGGGDFLALAHDPHPFPTRGALLLSDRVWRKRPWPPKSSRFEAIWSAKWPMTA